jgi:hypothetical protein
MMLTKFALAASIILGCTASLSADEPAIVECEAPPPDANEEMKKCYDQECRKLLLDLGECHPSPECAQAARALYHLKIAQCQDLRSATVETSDDLVVWLNLDSGEWEIAWPGEEIQVYTPRFEFNI